MATPTLQRPTNVGIVGGHPVIRGVVRLACDAIPGSEIVAEGSSLEEAAAWLHDRLDVLVVDLDLPDGNGLAILETFATGPLRTAHAPRILVLSDRADGATVLDALRLGATGFLTKSDGLRGVTQAVRDVAAGKVVLPPSIEASAIAELGRFARSASERARLESTLTRREREVLADLAEGRTMRQIARRLVISPRTVETHVSKVYAKLEVRSRVQAISRAASLGLIEL